MKARIQKKACERCKTAAGAASFADRPFLPPVSLPFSVRVRFFRIFGMENGNLLF